MKDLLTERYTCLSIRIMASHIGDSDGLLPDSCGERLIDGREYLHVNKNHNVID